jgi:hypothetical protein
MQINIIQSTLENVVLAGFADVLSLRFYEWWI